MKPYLSNDVTFEILQRLSARSLSRFRLACRRWNIWISDPRFVEQERYKTSRKNSLFIRSIDDYGGAQLFSVDSRNNLVNTHHKLSTGWPDFANIIGTCLELICMHQRGEIYLFNPTTEELITIFRPSQMRPSAVGFGYVSSTREYKVVRICDGRCRVLTVKRGMRWRTAENPPFALVDLFPSSATFANGSLHYISEVSKKIAAFDIETERWSEIPHPIVGDDNFMSLAELQGMLCVAESVENDFWAILRIWMLKDYNAGVWTNEYTIDLSRWSCLQFNSYVIPLLIGEDGRILIHHRDLQELYYYDPSEKTFSKIDNLRVTDICRYVDSFFSLQKIAASPKN